ncbi:MAG: methionyl-tRNA formyltransferase [Clostridia bacterium]|nr:methionyl-tRNA formyltransferase [Clostridia bacterium]
MKVLFMGTPDFAIPSLDALVSRHEVVGVVTQPDRPRGRGGKITPCAVKARALELGLPVYQFEKISREGVDLLKSLGVDIMVTAAFGQILSDEILAIAPHGVINVHGSILPKYRGSSPIQHAILKGEKETGVTIMQTAHDVDSGDIIHAKTTPIEDSDGTVSLFDRLARLGADALIEAMDKIEKGIATRTPQNHEEATFCKMLDKSDAVIDWTKGARELSCQIRAFDYVGASTIQNGVVVKLFRPEVVDREGNCGEVVECSDKTGIIVACGEKALKIGEILPAGGKRITTADYVRGRKIEKGVVFGK